MNKILKPEGGVVYIPLIEARLDYVDKRGREPLDPMCYEFEFKADGLDSKRVKRVSLNHTYAEDHPLDYEVELYPYRDDGEYFEPKKKR